MVLCRTNNVSLQEDSSVPQSLFVIGKYRFQTADQYKDMLHSGPHKPSLVLPTQSSQGHNRLDQGVLVAPLLDQHEIYLQILHQTDSDLGRLSSPNSKLS